MEGRGDGEGLARQQKRECMEGVGAAAFAAAVAVYSDAIREDALRKGEAAPVGAPRPPHVPFRVPPGPLGFAARRARPADPERMQPKAKLAAGGTERATPFGWGG
eukprot:364336-Chlamydomonas_euryale.AAC.4